MVNAAAVRSVPSRVKQNRYEFHSEGSSPAPLQQVSHIVGHFFDLGAVELFDVPERPHVIVADKIDRHALAAEPSRPSDAMNVQLPVEAQIVTNDQTHLLDVNPTPPQIGSNQHAGAARPEFFHDRFARRLFHIPVNGRDGEIAFTHLGGQPIDLLFGVAEDDRLRDGERVVQVAQRAVRWRFIKDTAVL